MAGVVSGATAFTKRPTKVLRCSCKHPYQDSAYGKEMRVFNPIKKNDLYRCTVCGKEKD